MSRILLSITLTLGLFACSDKGDEGDDTGAQTTSSTTTTTGTTTTTTTGTTGTTSTTTSARTTPADVSDCTAFHAGDAVTDGVVAHTLVYNGAGQLVSNELDIDGDSVIDSATTYAWAPNGQVSAIYTDYDADGIDDQVETHSYYASGNLEWAYIDWENDGTDDIEFHYTEVGGDITTIDIDGRDGGGIDGVVDEMKVYTYDGNGDMLRETVDLGNDGVDDEYLDYQRPGDFGGEYATLRDGPVPTYDPFGVVTGYDPALPDGIVDDWREWTFDIDGRIEFIYFDDGNDGVVEATYDWLYNPDGTTASQIGEIWYGDASVLDDGFLDLSMTYTYDVDGYLQEVYVFADVDADGTVGPLDLEATDTWIWTCP